MDDDTIAGTEETVLSDLRTLITKLNEVDLEINDAECEATLLHHTYKESDETVRAFRKISLEGCSLLGTPLSHDGIPAALEEKSDDLDLMISHLQVIHPHQAFVLLKKCFSIPKLQYLLRTSPNFKYPISL